MKKYKEIENILKTIKSEIDAHIKFKKKYDKQLAFDFNIFQFFSTGENKISQILAFFLDINQNHAQGDIFLREFIETFYQRSINIKQIENTCEKIITKKRRIDVYIKLTELTIAIENKIWADDQTNQLKDYSEFLENDSNGNYILLYLTPYGIEPKLKSINEELKKNLLKQNKLKIIGYTQDLIPLINKWLAICEADNVLYFLKEFKKYLEINFIGKNTLNMKKELREIIYKNEREVQALVTEYKSIENETLNKLNKIGKALHEVDLKITSDIKIKKFNTFNWEGLRIYKWSISKNDNEIFVQFIKNGIHLYSSFYLNENTDRIFENILQNLNINKDIKIDYRLNIQQLKDIFISQVNIVIESFNNFNQKINNYDSKSKI